MLRDGFTGMCRIAATVALTVATASAQAPPLAPSPPPTAISPQWSAGFGYESFWFRDISGTGIPMATSPVTWEGTGPALTGRALWRGEHRHHLVELSGARAGNFQYATSLDRRPIHGDDSATRMGARYEYLRYPFRNVLVDGLAFGFGVEAVGGRTSFTRRIAPATSARDVRYGGGGGGILTASVRRSPSMGLEVFWSNGLILGHRQEDWQSDGPDTSNRSGGGGWLTRLDIEGDVRLIAATRLFVRLTVHGEGFLSSHRSYAVGRNTIVAGVSYAR